MAKTVRACEVQSHILDAEGKTLFDAETINAVLDKKSHCIKEYAFIFHEQDRYTKEEENKNPEHIEGQLKPPHFHLYMRFERNQPQQFADVAKWFGLEPQYVRKIKSWEGCILYLVHKNAPEKFQYSPEDVFSNFNVQTIINHAEEKEQLSKILRKILTGEIREYNKTLEIDNMTLVRESKKISEAFKVRAEYLQATRQNRNIEVIFITGRAGSGKTTLAKRIAAEKKLDNFISSSNNDILDGYAQQPCVILDDIRPDSLGISDLLKLLDNHTASTIKSRYRNKFLCAELIILTSVLNIEEFHQNVYGHEHEPIEQLKRRCGTYIEIEPNGIIISRWDNVTRQYSIPAIFKNDIISQYIPPAPKNMEEIYEEIENLVPFLIPDTLPDDVRQRMKEPSKINETAPDDVYLKLMPLDRGGGYDG